MLSRGWLCLLLACGLALGARVARADCANPQPRVLWSYPADGQTGASLGAPLLIRGELPIGQVAIARPGDPSPPLILDNRRTYSAQDVQLLVVGAPQLAGAGEQRVSVGFGAGNSDATFGFSTQQAVAADLPTLAIVGHFVDGHVSRLSARCQELLVGDGGGICWDSFPNTRLIGFDVQVQAPPNATPLPGSVVAWVVEGVQGGGEASQPRLWPAECGPPSLFTTLDIDDPDHCFRVLAYVDNYPLPAASDDYCLGGGTPWPAQPVEDATPDPSTQPDAGMLPPGQGWPPEGIDCSGPCGCVNACDLIDPLAGTGAPQPVASRGAAGTDALGGDGGAGADRDRDASGAGVNDGAASDAKASESGGCGVGGRSHSRGVAWWSAWAALALALKRRRAVRAAHSTRAVTTRS